MTGPTDFYEEDEAAENIHAAFERGEKGITAEPRWIVSGVEIHAGNHGVCLGKTKGVTASGTMLATAGWHS